MNKDEKKGWILIHRKIKDNWIWDDPVYLKAWLTILLEVNHEYKKVNYQGEFIACKRGQSVLSLQGWANAFGKKWTIQKVRTFFKLLQKDLMIETKGLRKTTRLTVCNYDTYQDSQQTDNTQPTRSQHAANNKQRMNKELKEGLKKGSPTKVENFVSYQKPKFNDRIYRET